MNIILWKGWNRGRGKKNNKTIYIKTKGVWLLYIVDTARNGDIIKKNVYIKKGLLFEFNPLEDGFWIQNSRIKLVVVRSILIYYLHQGKGGFFFHSTFLLYPFHLQCTEFKFLWLVWTENLRAPFFLTGTLNENEKERKYP